MTIKLLTLGIEVSDELFEKLREWCYKYRTGEIPASRFEEEYRKLGFTRAQAYVICSDIWEKRYKRLWKWYKVLIAISLVTTSTKGSWAERYFEVREFTDIPEKEYPPLFDMEIELDCKEADNLGEMFKIIAFNYMETKGYDVEMIVSSELKYAGIQKIEEFEDLAGRECDIYMEIWDGGSTKRIPRVDGKFVGIDREGMRRFWNTFKLGSKYWENLLKTCNYVITQMREFRFTKHKGVRW